MKKVVAVLILISVIGTSIYSYIKLKEVKQINKDITEKVNNINKKIDKTNNNTNNYNKEIETVKNDSKDKIEELETWQKMKEKLEKAL